MRIITPERVALSAITYGAGTDEIDILDFDFGADEGLIINAVEGLLSTAGTFADVQVAIAQELNLDSDIAAGEHWAKTDRTVIDSPIVFWHRMDVTTGIDDGAGGGVVAVSSGHKEIDWVERQELRKRLTHLLEQDPRLWDLFGKEIKDTYPALAARRSSHD